MKIFRSLVALSLASIQFVHADPASYTRTDIITYTTESGFLDEIGLLDQFSGHITLQKTCLYIPLTLQCQLSFETRVFDSADHLVFELDKFSSSGPGFCSTWLFPGSTQPWQTSIAHNDLPSPGVGFYEAVGLTISDVSIDTGWCGKCEGSLGGQYTNSNGGELQFNGSLSAPPELPFGNCSIYGIIKSENYIYEIWH